MLRLKRLEIRGFGPFADQQVLEFPDKRGVVVVYGENMRGKTSLLNAIRYAFFGKVLGRGSRERRLHTISNRDLAAAGQYGFSVSLTFHNEDHSYELIRECVPTKLLPENDDDYDQTVMLRRGSSVLGPQEREKVLHTILPPDVSRFFLFDGELLQEYEELLINESNAGRQISEAIERILGVPILKRGRSHLKQLADDADKDAAKEAGKHKETQSLGVALQQATEQKEAHQGELRRLHNELDDLTQKRVEAEQRLQSIQKYAIILEDRDQAVEQLDKASKDEEHLRGDLQRAMSKAWRSLAREPLRAARLAAQHESERELDSLILSLRSRAVDMGRCDTCEQDIPEAVRSRLRASLPKDTVSSTDSRAALSAAMARVGDLNKFQEADNAGEVRQLWKRIGELHLEGVALRDRITDLESALADPEEVRRTKSSYHDISEKIAIVKRGIEETEQKIAEKENGIARLKSRLTTISGVNLKATQLRANILRESANVFSEAVEQYKAELRARVEATASTLFRSMTTETEDYAGLTINEGYGLTIRHRDGRAEEARSAGAEHVVALALMGALQKNAPLRGPIVMDSPFGRLDERHTANVVRTLPEMAQQVVLLVYEAEVGRARMRELLGSALIREYELDRVTSRRTHIRLVK